jgi:hypothetical protein
MPVAVAQFPFVLSSCRKSLTFSEEGRALFCDIEIEDSGASIDLSPTNTVDSSQQVNQAAAASAQPVWVWTPWRWMSV